MAAVLPPSTFFENVAFNHLSFSFVNLSALPSKETSRNKSGHKVLVDQFIDILESSEF